MCHGMFRSNIDPVKLYGTSKFQEPAMGGQPVCAEKCGEHPQAHTYRIDNTVDTQATQASVYSQNTNEEAESHLLERRTYTAWVTPSLPNNPSPAYFLRSRSPKSSQITTTKSRSVALEAQ